MRNLMIIAIWVLIALALPFSSAVGKTAPSEKSFLKAWEEQQKSDPKTKIFERITDSRYRFKTERFPFDGELELLNVGINEQSGYETIIMGFAEVELKGVDDSFFRKFGTSYNLWAQNNSLYYLNNTGEWLPVNEWSLRYGAQDEDAYHEGEYSIWSAYGESVIYIVILLLFAIFLIFIARRSSKQVKKSLDGQNEALEIMRRSVALQEESHTLSKEILVELRRIRGVGEKYKNIKG